MKIENLKKTIESWIINEMENSEHAVVEKPEDSIIAIVKTDYKKFAKVLADKLIYDFLIWLKLYGQEALNKSRNQQEFMKLFFDGINNILEDLTAKYKN